MPARGKGHRGQPEQPAVRTTIVGGRPPGAGKGLGDIPRHIEVLLKKAAIDPEFRALLLEQRAKAAEEIGLTLEPAEAAMLRSVPAAQLEAIIAHTEVSPMTRAAFLGRAAAAMLAALGAEVADAGYDGSRGIKPDIPPDRQILYKETSYKGEASYGLMPGPAFRTRQRQVARMSSVLRRAYAVAAQAWKEEATHQDVPFPMKPPQPSRLEIVSTCADRVSVEKARAWLEERQAESAKQREEQLKKEQERLAGLSEEERQWEKARAAAAKEAQALFEAKLKELLEAPPAVKGIRPH